MALASSGRRDLTDTTLNRAFSNSILPNQYHTVSGASAVASEDPYTHALSINDISRFSFASLAPHQSPKPERDDPTAFGDFLSPLNFDDFHTSITSTEPNLSQFPLPGSGSITPAQATLESGQAPLPNAPSNSAPKRAFESQGRKTSNPSANRPESMQNPNSSSLKGRRQSHFPPNSFNNGPAKAPRKSVGPGTFLPPDSSENTAPQRKPSLGSRKRSGESTREGMSARTFNKNSSLAENKSAPTSRATKAKSLHVTGLTVPVNLLTPSRTPENPWATSHSKPSTPNRGGGSGTPGQPSTPGASTGNRRLSVMPHHAKGLGARTISPTDARRMRRMSTMPTAPPLPSNRISTMPPPPPPQPELPAPKTQSPLPSPGLAPRKSITPSSSRTTPDPNRKSYSSGQSLSSSTSYGSARNSATIPVRFPLPISSSRLPTPKPRLDTTITDEEEVPPVPPLPKAYESPASEIDVPFFSARSSSLPPLDTPTSDSLDVSSLADAMKALETPRAPSTSSARSGIPHSETEPRLKPPPGGAKKKTQSQRLPPLNLLPLGTPTTSKIKAFKEPRTSMEDGALTPPQRDFMKTPSTPLTASKAGFFSRSKRTSDEEKAGPFRSSTSHQILGFGDDRRPPSSVSPSLPPFAFEGASDARRNISPFVSTSLPKNSGEFPQYLRSNFGAELNRGQIPSRPNGPRAPSFSVTPKPEKESPVESDGTTMFSPGAIKRKLSRKRSESNSREPTLEQFDAAKYDNMPPPKLPASATWTSLTSLNQSPIQSKTGFLKSRRKISSSSVSLQADEAQPSSHPSAQGLGLNRPNGVEKGPTTIHASRSGSMLNLAQNLTAHKSNTQIRTSSSSSLDRDDLIAEEEMKKLAAKRRDFEVAARELDVLRKRARAAVPMAPTEALQMAELNIYERGEIIDFPDVFFTGNPAARKISGDLNHEASNFGYDDERGDYNIIEGDHLGYRYEVVDILGKGSFGQVVRCVDHKTGILVAVKIIRNKKRFHQQALVEVNILQRLKEWVSLVSECCDMANLQSGSPQEA